MKKIIIILIFSFALTGCASTPRPRNVNNVCHIFNQYPQWYWDAKRTQKRWGLPVWIQMAIIYQESRFAPKAKPPRERILWVIPWFRPTSAYGYSQAVDSTWDLYVAEAGHFWSSRDTFSNATDFIGWYAHRAHKKLGISLYNAYALYLAYHEGIGGYQRKTYRRKRWLMAVAKKVERRAQTYRRQLRDCESDIKSPGFFGFFY